MVVGAGAAILLLAPALPYFLDDQDVNAFLLTRKRSYRFLTFRSLVPGLPGALVATAALLACLSPRWPHWRWLFGLTAALGMVGSLVAFGLAQGYRSRPDMYTAVIQAIATFAVGATVIGIGALLMPREEGMRSLDPALPSATS